MNKSVSTINSPEFINLAPLEINPLMSSCEIKVLYVGENRNHSFITKEVAIDMAKTLRGAPIVGYYKEDKQDFADHGEVVIIDDEGIKFECKTVPYGFVAPDAKVWFQTFVDTNELGEEIIREYLMTNGYLWTGQFPECKSAVEGDGKPQSMELDEQTINGHWTTNTKGIDFFIINDAVFSKLCILGSDVEPCFEGASVAAPDVNASFAKVDDTFKHTLFTMMQELAFALQGGQTMDVNTEPTVVEELVQEPSPIIEEQVIEESIATEPAPVVAPEGENSVEPASEFKKEEDKDDEDKDEPKEDKEDEDDDEDKKKYALLEEQFNELQSKFDALQADFNIKLEECAALQASNTELAAFKAQVEDAQKDAMIEKFSMLSDEDKKEIVANKANYTVEDIEEKLSVICFRKQVNFDLSNTSKNDIKSEPIVTFNYANIGTSEPAWITAVKQNKNKNI